MSVKKALYKSPIFNDRFISSRISIEFMQNFDRPNSTSKEICEEELSDTIEDDKQNKLYDALMKNQILGLKHSSEHINTENFYKDLDPKLLFYETFNTQNQIADNRFSLSPAGGLDTPIYSFNTQRTIPKTPYKVLDAPELQDDYYLDVIHWSREDMLAVGLGRFLYLWVSSNGKVIKLHEFERNDAVASVAWCPEKSILAAGSNRGHVCIWDYPSGKELLRSKVHHSRVGSISWSPQSLILSTGSRDRTIAHRDIRAGIKSDKILCRSIEHKQEVCGIRWSPDEQYLCSGSNDNKVLIWSKQKLETPSLRFNEHTAAVKAIAWSPHQNGLLATGGGTTDRYLKLWDVTTGQSKGGIDTGSQICNMIWGINVNEIVTTHGYSTNKIAIWKSDLKCIAQLSGHLSRVLYIAMASDGRTVVTGSGDETLRFWEVFPPNKYQIEEEQEWNVYPSRRNIR